MKAEVATELRSELRALSHDELLSRTQILVQRGRRITVEVLQHLAEIDNRRAYAKLGYASLWDYTIKELKYSESAAYRRISAMRALQAIPELESKIQSGALSVTAVSQVNTFLKAERQQANRVYTKTEKTAIFEKCENLSSREVTRELTKISPLALRVQKERAIAENRTELTFIVDSDLLGKIHRVRDLSVSRLENPGSYPELMNFMSEVTLDEIDPLRRPVRQKKGALKAEGSEKPAQVGQSAKLRQEKPLEEQGGFKLLDQSVALIAPQPTAPIKNNQNSRFIPASIRAQVWSEFEGKCAFVDPASGRRCNSTFGLEIEHCKPHALGGSSSTANLRLLCRHHNQWQAIQTYGLGKMLGYLKPKDEEVN